MDKLEQIFQMQKAFDDSVVQKRKLENISKEEWLLKLSIALSGEIAEVNNELNYKWWKTEKPVNWDNVREELSDIFHFFVAICIRAEMSAEDLFSEYLKKNSENVKRQQGLSEKMGYE